MIEEALRRQLEPVVARRRHLSLAWQLSIYWLACGLAGLVLVGADRLLGWRSPLAIWALCAAIATATLWAIHRSRRLRPDYRVIARNIEQEHPDLKALLLAAQNTTGAREAFEIALKWAKSEPFIGYARDGLALLPK